MQDMSLEPAQPSAFFHALNRAHASAPVHLGFLMEASWCVRAQGQRLRFMVRDREGAMQDMRDHAVQLKRRSLQARPPPALPVMGLRGFFEFRARQRRSHCRRQMLTWPGLDRKAARAPTWLICACYDAG